MVKVWRINDYGMLSLKWDICIILPSLPRLREHSKRGYWNIISVRYQEMEILLQSNVFWTWWDCCIHELTALVVVNTELVLYQISHHSRMSKEGDCEPSTPRSVASCSLWSLEKESQFSLAVWSMVSWPCTSGWYPISISIQEYRQQYSVLVGYKEGGGRGKEVVVVFYFNTLYKYMKLPWNK